MRSYSSSDRGDSVDKLDMEIISIGHQGFQQAQRRASAQAEKLVKNGPEIDNIIGLKAAEQEAAIAAKVIKVGRDIEDSLLDILA